MDNNPPGQPQFTPPAPAPSPFGPAPAQQPMQPMAPPPMASKPKSRKGIIIAISAIIAILTIASGGFWWWMTQAQNDFAKASTAYVQKAKDAYEFYRDSGNPSSKSTEILKKFDDAIAAKPAAPSLLVFGSSSIVQHNNQVSTSLASVRDSFNVYHSFKAYGDSVVEIAGKAYVYVSTIEELRTAKTAFNTAAADLRKLDIPKTAEKFNEDLAKIYDLMATDIDAALKAYDAGNETSYTQAINKLATDVQKASSKNVANDLNDMYDAAYKTLTKNYDDLATVLGE